MGELIGTGSRTIAAANAFESAYRLGYLHSLDQAADALEIAGTAAREADIMNAAIDDFEFHGGGAGALVIV